MDHRRNRICLNHVPDAECGDCGENCEDPAKPFLFHSSLEHIHRTSGHQSCFGFHSVFHRENCFGIFCGDSEDAGQPHPEDGAGAASGDRCSYADDVAGADGSGQSSRQRAELAYIALSFVRSLDGKFDRLADVSLSLDEAKPEREKNVGAEQKNQERWSPDKIAKLSDKFFEFLHETPCLSGKNYRVAARKAREKLAESKIDGIVANPPSAFETRYGSDRQHRGADQFGCMISRTK